MNFESLSEKYKEIKLPSETSDGIFGNENRESSLMNTLLSQEAEAGKKYRRMYILYAIGAVAYFSVYIINPDTDLTPANRIAGICFILAFGILAVLSRKRFNEISRASYLDSQKQFLLNAQKSYSFWNKQQLWLIPVLLLVNTGATLSVIKHFHDSLLIPQIILFQLGFWCLMIFGYFMGKRVWTKRKKPTLQKIEAMLLEFEQ